MFNRSKKKKSTHSSILFRYLIITGFILLAAGYIAYCTFQNTVLHAKEWNERAHEELSRTSTVVLPERGDILAADGTVLATTMQYYTLRIDFGSEAFLWKDYVASMHALADSMHRYFPIKGGLKAWQDSLSAVPSNPRYNKEGKIKRPRGWRLIRNITFADYQRILTFPFFSEHKQYKTGLLAEPSKRRTRPYGEMAQMSIGIVSEDTNRQIHGYSGLEYALDSLLFGIPGTTKKVNFTRGIGNWTDIPAVRGWDVTSTIDIHMQDILESALLERLQSTRAEWGTAVLMDVVTGEIKAISNFEEYPPKSGSGNYVEAMNRAVRPFEPGSVVKTISMLIALEDGYVNDLDSVVTIGASYRAYGMGSPITDSHHNSQLTVAGVLEQSSNIGMARLITPHVRNPQHWHDRLASIGFLDKFNSGIGEEMAPRYPVKPINAGGLVDLSRQVYGYAAEIPPLHTLSIYNAIANNGRYVRPHLVKELHREGQDSIVPISLVTPHLCSEVNAKKLQHMLSLVVNGDHGTARSLRNPYVKLAGKTGTCYMVDEATGKYNHAHKRLAFCGFFPADEPRYSCIVLIAHPREEAFGAASTSGVVLRNVALAMYARGMLGFDNNFAESETPADNPVIYSSGSESDSYALLSKHFGINGRRLAGAKDVTPAPGQVPDVCGMGLRSAVHVLEQAGYNVNFSGTGYVRSQTPAAGVPTTRGTTVTLALVE